MAKKGTRAILIVGGSGFIGTHLALRLRDSYKVYATYNKHRILIPGVTLIPFHVSDRNWMKRVVYNAQPEFVVYAAGSNDVETAEKDAKFADMIHVGGCGGVLGVSDIFKPKFIMFSNSYVFNGNGGNFRETDSALPDKTLGKLKVSAENYLRGHSLNHMIIRSSPLFGRGNGIGQPSFLDVLRAKLSRGQTVVLSTQELQSYAPVTGLAEMVARIIETGIKNRTLHYGGLTRISPFEFGRLFAKRFGYDENLIKEAPPDPNLKEGQVLDYSLNSTEMAKTLKINPLILEEGFDLLDQQLIPRSRATNIP